MVVGCTNRVSTLLFLYVSLLDHVIVSRSDASPNDGNGEKKYELSSEAYEEKRRALDDIGKAAQTIECTVCQLAARNISATMASRNFRWEEDINEALEDLCKKDDVGLAEYLIKEEFWQLKTSPTGVYTLELPNLEEYREGKKASEQRKKDEQERKAAGHKNWQITTYPEIQAMNSISAACNHAVGDSQTELAEFLYARTVKKGDPPSSAEVTDKLCSELADICQKAKPTTSKDSSKKEL